MYGKILKFLKIVLLEFFWNLIAKFWNFAVEFILKSAIGLQFFIVTVVKFVFNLEYKTEKWPSSQPQPTAQARAHSPSPQPEPIDAEKYGQNHKGFDFNDSKNKSTHNHKGFDLNVSKKKRPKTIKALTPMFQKKSTQNHKRFDLKCSKKWTQNQ